ncbi:MAG: hypothetical protein ACLPKH_03335 [Rhodomicrobium sp.]
MPFKIEKASGLILLILAIVVAIVAGASMNDAPNPVAIPSILVAAFGIMAALWVLRRS